MSLKINLGLLQNLKVLIIFNIKFYFSKIISFLIMIILASEKDQGNSKTKLNHYDEEQHREDYEFRLILK